MDSKDINITTFNLLQPYLLTEKELTEILKSRCIDRDISSCTKEELVELFKRIALPLPQREYGTTHREKRLTLKQKKKNKTVIRIDEGNVKTSSDVSVIKTSSPVETKTPATSRFQQTPERLRPPPDLVNYKRKIIKITESSKKMIRSELDKIVIINKKKEIGTSDISSSSTTRIPATSSVNGRLSATERSSVTVAQRKSSSVTVPQLKSPSVVKLKRDSLVSQQEAQTSSESTTDGTPQKKKRQKIVISW